MPETLCEPRVKAAFVEVFSHDFRIQFERLNFNRSVVC